jgi:hypothetical protein
MARHKPPNHCTITTRPRHDQAGFIGIMIGGIRVLNFSQSRVQFTQVIPRLFLRHGVSVVEKSPLRDWARGTPFIPFTVTMSGGRQITVSNPEMIILGRHWDTVAFVDDEGFDRIVVLQHVHIDTIDAYDPVLSPAAP